MPKWRPDYEQTIKGKQRGAQEKRDLGQISAASKEAGDKQGNREPSEREQVRQGVIPQIISAGSAREVVVKQAPG
jgi:hypothetical protein